MRTSERRHPVLPQGRPPRARLRRRLRRSTFSVVGNWPELAAELSRRPHIDLIIADVDPAVAGWHAKPDQVRAGLARAESILAGAAALCPLVWTTNSVRHADQPNPVLPRTPSGHRLLLGAGKPRTCTLAREIDALQYRCTVVTGDQWLTDGLLARRLHAHFVLWKDPHQRPTWAKLQYAFGWLLIRPQFTRHW